MPWTLASLPDDALLLVISYLTLRDLIALRKVRSSATVFGISLTRHLIQTCTTFLRMTKTKGIWVNILERDLPSDNMALPPYRNPIDNLSALQTERLALHCLRLQRRMAGGLPPLSVVNMPRSLSVNWVRIVRGQWILVASSDANTSAITIWTDFPGRHLSRVGM